MFEIFQDFPQYFQCELQISWRKSVFGKKKICRRLNDILGVKSTSQMQMLSFGGQFNPWWVLNSMSCTTMIYSGDFFYSALSHVSLNREILSWEGKKGDKKRWYLPTQWCLQPWGFTPAKNPVYYEEISLQKNIFL